MVSSVESVWLMGLARYVCLPNITRFSGKSRQRFSSDEIRMRHRSGDDLVRVLFEEATKAGTRPSPLLSHARSFPLETVEKPGLGIRPVALDGAFGQAKDLRRFALAQSDKKPELDHLGFGGVSFLELGQRLVQREDRFLLDGRSDFDLVNVQPLLATAVSARAEEHTSEIPPRFGIRYAAF